ncbi:7-carboxy-7-deazaguanine synthase QueE [Glaciecola sp. XM2]|uniref:7-carboxy-7-deazaguanine synthase QueE n=1 Tax=Glaciecola sp. XM2 TaxID=1914931 RepID=UPI001BDE0AFE|nr:7-carboxy-7-deazaguanine synthase QueE [Glaciecola sp. XM2]MBT1450938.1 7-carboxy-7-deazaguanine synthase QueE [Glaciecola sp. XM2]
MTRLLVNEVFESIQGEGAFTGVPSIFVRLQGCPVGCPWCDTKHTWETKPENVREQDVIMQETVDTEHYFSGDTHDIFRLFEKQGYRAKNIVLTGGEPCMFDLTEFSTAAIAKGYSVQIETSGTFEIICHPDVWVTLSPKINMKGGFEVRKDALVRANEIKHPIAMQKHIDELDSLLASANLDTLPVIYLQPISMQKRATQLAVATCIERNWRLSLQTHKFIGVE